MAKNIDFMGAIFPDVPSVKLPQQGGGLVSFDDTTDATATASDIAEGKTAYVNGAKITGTASGGGSAVIEALSVTSNGTYTAPSGVDGYSPVTVNVSGGGGGLTLLKTESLGTLSTTSTSATDTGKSLSLPLTVYNNYDLLIIDVSVDTVVIGRHTSTVSMIFLSGTQNVTTKNSYTIGSNRWNSRVDSSGVSLTRQNTTAYGIYAQTVTTSDDTATIPLYYRYNGTNTGTLNGSYTARLYGVSLYDLIGG